MTAPYKFAHEDSGNYRVYYRAAKPRGVSITRALYCIQNDGAWSKDNFKFYRCSQDGEPDYEVKFPDAAEFDRLVYPDSIERKSLP